VYLKAALNTPAIKSPGNPGMLVAKSITVNGKIWSTFLIACENE
jgi:hypothetical protein